MRTDEFQNGNRTCKVTYILNDAKDYYDTMIIEYITNGEIVITIECSTNEHIEHDAIFEWCYVAGS